MPKKVRSLYEISGIIDGLLEGKIGSKCQCSSAMEDIILATLTDVNERLDTCDRKIANLERYARKLKKKIAELIANG